MGTATCLHRTADAGEGGRERLLKPGLHGEVSAFGAARVLLEVVVEWLIRSTTVRYAIRLSVFLTAAALVACTGSQEPTAPPLAQRFLTAADAPGTQRDPVLGRETAAGLDEFIPTFGPHLIDPNIEEMTRVFKEAGFQGAGSDARSFGQTHAPHAPHLFDTFYELESEDGARSALDWLEADSMKPCPNSCAVRISNFDVDDIPDARGTHRIATAEDIQALGTEDERPSEDYWVGFTVDSIVYTVLLRGPPGSVSEEQAQKIVSAYYDRLTGT
jgi:hypothetical protein